MYLPLTLELVMTFVERTIPRVVGWGECDVLPEDKEEAGGGPTRWYLLSMARENRATLWSERSIDRRRIQLHPQCVVP
jgi:hypothetical protein